MVSPSLKLAAIQLGAILILQSANPLIAIMIGTAAIPPYEGVSKIAATMMTLALLIVNSSSPFLSMAYAAGEYGKVTLLLVRNLRLGLGLIVVLAAFAAVNGDRIVAVWLGSSMFAGFPVLWVLLFMVLFEVHHVIFATAVMAAGKIVFVRTALASGILNIVLAVSLAGRLGLLGIALAIAVGQLLTNNWYAPYVAIRFFRIPAAMLAREVWAPVGVLLVLQLAGNILIRQTPWLSGSGLAALLTSCVLSVASGAGMWWLLALRSTERMQIREYCSAGFARIKVEHA
jgi:O-antigen/teichoic acid export membrane protein